MLILTQDIAILFFCDATARFGANLQYHNMIFDPIIKKVSGILKNGQERQNNLLVTKTLDNSSANVRVTMKCQCLCQGQKFTLCLHV